MTRTYDRYQHKGNLKPKTVSNGTRRFDSSVEQQAFNKLCLNNSPENIIDHYDWLFSGQGSFVMSKNIDFWIPNKNLFIEVKSNVITPEFRLFLAFLNAYEPDFLRKYIIAVPKPTYVTALMRSQVFKNAVSQGMQIIPFSQLSLL